jgi:succinate-acetate transporter protein
MLGVLMFFGGVCQFIAGIMEFVSGNTVSATNNDSKMLLIHVQFGATVFPSYGAFNFAYAMIYIPGTGILDSYTDKTTGLLNDQFANALGIWLWAWFILTVIYTVAAMRSSWVLFFDLFFLDIELLLLACGYMLNMESLLKAGNGFGFVVAALSCKLKSTYYTLVACLTNMRRLGWHSRTLGKWYHPDQSARFSHVHRKGLEGSLDKRPGVS